MWCWWCVMLFLKFTWLAWTEPVLLPFDPFMKVRILLFDCQVSNRNINSVKTSVSITVRISVGSNLSPKPLESVNQTNTPSLIHSLSLALEESHFMNGISRGLWGVLGILDSSFISVGHVMLICNKRKCTSDCWDCWFFVSLLHTSDIPFTAAYCLLEQVTAVHPAFPWPHKLQGHSTCVMQHTVSVKSFATSEVDRKMPARNILSWKSE